MVYSICCPTSVIEFLSNISVNCIILVKAVILLVIQLQNKYFFEMLKKKKKEEYNIDENLLFSWYYHFFILSHHSVDYPEPQYVRKYIVFEHCLLSLFRSCNKCGHLCTDITKHTIGTFLRLKRYCKACDDTVTWDSQTFIRNAPAGNILLSSSILFSGALPTKVLRVLPNLGCASITKRTYFNHLSSACYTVSME